MSHLSITFHCPTEKLMTWDKYLSTKLLHQIDSISSIDQYLFSEVESEMIDQGKNFNLFVFFSSISARESFINNHLQDIESSIVANFGNDVMLFVTHLNPIQHRKLD